MRMAYLDVDTLCAEGSEAVARDADESGQRHLLWKILSMLFHAGYEKEKDIAILTFSISPFCAS